MNEEEKFEKAVKKAQCIRSRDRWKYRLTRQRVNLPSWTAKIFLLIGLACILVPAFLIDFSLPMLIADVIVCLVSIGIWALQQKWEPGSACRDEDSLNRSDISSSWYIGRHDD